MKRDCPDFYRNEEQNPSLSAFEVKRFNLTLLKKLTVFTNKYGYIYWLLTVFSFGEGGGGEVALGEGGGDLIVNVSYGSTLLREILIVASVISMHQPPVSHILHSMVDLL